jgi:hypothetical protein
VDEFSTLWLLVSFFSDIRMDEVLGMGEVGEGDEGGDTVVHEGLSSLRIVDKGGV